MIDYSANLPEVWERDASRTEIYLGRNSTFLPSRYFSFKSKEESGVSNDYNPNGKRSAQPNRVDHLRSNSFGSVDISPCSPQVIWQCFSINEIEINWFGRLRSKSWARFQHFRLGADVVVGHPHPTWFPYKDGVAIEWRVLNNECASSWS